MPKEDILIIAVKRPDDTDEKFQTSVNELISLSKTAGGTVRKVITQNRSRIHPAFYIGTGKLKEIKLEIVSLGIDLVISNDELSAGQLRNLENDLGIRVIDRSQLILDILQVEQKQKKGNYR